MKNISFSRCSDGADRLREHWDQNRCGEPDMNVTSLDQCSRVQESDHTEWRNSMVKDPEAETEIDASSTSAGSAAGIVSAVISTILVLILLLILLCVKRLKSAKCIRFHSTLLLWC